jgi:hypothetical protein
MIRSWNTYVPAEFARHNIGSPDHPRFAEFLEVLRDPRLEAGFIEFWGFHSVDVAALHAARSPARSEHLSDRRTSRAPTVPRPVEG